jgi:L-amino acid N-acyltransferase YncA
VLGKNGGMTASRHTAVFRPATATDAAGIASIYNHYIEHSIITFEEDPVPAAEMATRIAEVQASSLPWLVAEENGAAIGYAYATKWRARTAYRFSVEVTVYVAPDRPRRGIGSGLYRELFPMLQKRGANAVLAGIALPNEASVALHERFGLRKVAHLEEVGFKHDRWIDVGYWQCVLRADGVAPTRPT